MTHLSPSLQALGVEGVWKSRQDSIVGGSGSKMHL